MIAFFLLIESIKTTTIGSSYVLLDSSVVIKTQKIQKTKTQDQIKPTTIQQDSIPITNIQTKIKPRKAKKQAQQPNEELFRFINVFKNNEDSTMIIFIE